MDIKTIQPNRMNSPAFGAIPVAKVRAKASNSVYRLYQLEQTDRTFLERLSEKVDVRNLYPNLTEDEHFIWDGSLKKAIDTSLDTGRTAYLETCDGVPCGIMNYSGKPNSIHFDRIATFPIKKGERVPYAGQILYHQLYKQFLKEGKESISVVSPRHSPFSPIANYVRMGFKLMGGTEYTENLKISEDAVKKAYANQQKFLTFDRFKKSESVNLEKVADLTPFE